VRALKKEDQRWRWRTGDGRCVEEGSVREFARSSSIDEQLELSVPFFDDSCWLQCITSTSAEVSNLHASSISRPSSPPQV
jgi:hypothetical protein